MKDPEARTHTAEIIAGLEGRHFEPWAGTRWMKRGEDYEELKSRIADGLLAEAERRLPGLSKLVVHRELSTPLSTAHFTGHAGGEIYGLPATPDRFARRWLRSPTPVPGLYLAGADALMLGIGGAVMSGIMCTAAVAGFSTFGRVRSAAKESPRSRPRLQPFRRRHPLPSPEGAVPGGLVGESQAEGHVGEPGSPRDEQPFRLGLPERVEDGAPGPSRSREDAGSSCARTCRASGRPTPASTFPSGSSVRSRARRATSRSSTPAPRSRRLARSWRACWSAGSARRMGVRQAAMGISRPAAEQANVTGAPSRAA